MNRTVFAAPGVQKIRQHLHLHQSNNLVGIKKKIWDRGIVRTIVNLAKLCSSVYNDFWNVCYDVLKSFQVIWEIIFDEAKLIEKSLAVLCDLKIYCLVNHDTHELAEKVTKVRKFRRNLDFFISKLEMIATQAESLIPCITDDDLASIELEIKLLYQYGQALLDEDKGYIYQELWWLIEDSEFRQLIVGKLQYKYICIYVTTCILIFSK